MIVDLRKAVGEIFEIYKAHSRLMGCREQEIKYEGRDRQRS